MRFNLIFACVTLLCAINVSMGQQPSALEKHRYVVLPAKNVLVTVASQPDCPLQLEGVKFLYDVDEKRLAMAYQLRNRGAKPLFIKSYTIAAWYSQGGGWTSGELGSKNGLLPGQYLSVNDRFEEVPLTNEWRDKLELRGGMRQVAVLMIESIEYTDGSTYSGKLLSEALASYFENSVSASSHGK
ncbi:MAG TPA: hypothetical protein VF553_17740 [Pyrinomonadaceae bacterium]|jgi:hypothetical protein